MAKPKKKAPSRPSKKPAAIGSSDARWGTKYMTESEKMSFGNMVYDHQTAEKKRSGRASINKKVKF